jgi:phosphoribosylamine--glycine ligase
VASAAGKVEALATEVVEPAIAALAARGTPFTGVLFAGVMLTSAGPRVLEYNARWGDPEAQALLPLLDTDLIEIMEACIAGRLRPETVHWRSGATVGVVLAAAGYPGTPRRGDAISLPALDDDIHLFHAGTALHDGELVTAGGRVLTVVGEGPTLEAARAQAYAYAGRIHFAGKQMRHDIGWRSLATTSQRG